MVIALTVIWSHDEKALGSFVGSFFKIAVFQATTHIFLSWQRLREPDKKKKVRPV